MRFWVERWGRTLVRFFGGKQADEQEGGVFLDAEAVGVSIHIAFGTVCEASGGAAEAVLVDVGVLERFVEVVRYSVEQRLPVDAWICSGLAHAPYSVREVVTWLLEMETLCVSARLIVRTGDMSENQKMRLVAELVRRGCRVHERCAIERAEGSGGQAQEDKFICKELGIDQEMRRCG